MKKLTKSLRNYSFPSLAILFFGIIFCIDGVIEENEMYWLALEAEQFVLESGNEYKGNPNDHLKTAEFYSLCGVILFVAFCIIIALDRIRIQLREKLNLSSGSVSGSKLSVKV